MGLAGYIDRDKTLNENMNDEMWNTSENGVFLRCKTNLRKFQSDLLAIFAVDKYNKTIKNR